MKVLGIRSQHDGFRYCILEKNEDEVKCLNLNEENKIVKPKGCDGTIYYSWIFDEVTRILDVSGDIDAVAIKQNENVKSCYSKLKNSMFLDCIVTIVAEKRDIPVSSFVYKQLGTNGDKVKEKAKRIINGTTNKYWDNKMADAIVAAYKLLDTKQ